MGTITPGQSQPRSNGNEGVLHIPQISKTGASPWFSVISRILVEMVVLSLRRDAVGVSDSPSQIGWNPLW